MINILILNLLPIIRVYEIDGVQGKKLIEREKLFRRGEVSSLKIF